MAISGPLYKLLRQIQPMLPRGGSLLEIGEANWYGDVEPASILDGLEILHGSLSEDIEEKKASRQRIYDQVESGDSFAIAKAFYATLFAPSSIVSIDMHGTPAALKFDLNKRLPLPSKQLSLPPEYFENTLPIINNYLKKGLWEEAKAIIDGFASELRIDSKFDVLINHGTAEHVFNIAQVFRSMHDRCEVDGVMIHDAPFTPWIDHGMYCLQPTLFYDLARANCYEVAHVSMYEIKSGWTVRIESRDHITRIVPPDNACLFVVYRKRYETEFCVPGQGVYSGGLSAAGRKAWEVNR